jgi:hypothetical protein
MLVTSSADIAETATGVKIPPSGEMSFASTTLIAMSSIKRFKAIYNHTTRLTKEIAKK